MKIYEKIEKIKRPIRVLQFGEGNFLRAFVDWMIDDLNRNTDFNGSVKVVQPIENGMTKLLESQKQLYTHIMKGIKDGNSIREFYINESLDSCIRPFDDFYFYL